ncbi:MAG: LysR family transcriptional regulator [Oscillospiraceae bacterium]
MDNSPIDIKIAIRLFFGGGKCFGPGPAQLLKAIDHTGSLRAAAAEMGMSYSKAWTLLRSCEKTLEFPLLEREVGGTNGGFSHLTAKGRDLLEKYNALENQLCAYGSSLVKELFAEYI